MHQSSLDAGSTSQYDLTQIDGRRVATPLEIAAELSPLGFDGSPERLLLHDLAGAHAGALSTGCSGGGSDTEPSALLEADDATPTADVLPAQAPAPSVGGETTDFGGGLSLCDNEGAMTFELALDEMGPDGMSVASHLEAVRGSYSVPMQWEASDSSQGSTTLDVVVEPTQMVRFEMWCRTPLKNWENQLFQYWSILSRISLTAEDGSVVGTLTLTSITMDGQEDLLSSGARVGSLRWSRMPLRRVRHRGQRSGVRGRRYTSSLLGSPAHEWRNRWSDR